MSRVACGRGRNEHGQATIPEAKISERNWEHEEPPYERWAIGVAKDDRWKDSSDVTSIGGDKAFI